jgi:cyclase
MDDGLYLLSSVWIHPMEPQLLTIAEGVYAWIGAGGDSNAGAIDTPHGLLVIDA